MSFKDIIKSGVWEMRYVKGRIGSSFASEKRTYYCPCCKSRIKKFTSGSFLAHPEIYDLRRFEGTEQNVLCPICRSFPRHRILCHWIEKNPERLKDKNILYFAPNPAVLKFLRSNKYSVTTADKYVEADLTLDIMEIDLPSESQDVIICNHVMEYIEDYRVGFSELNRILKKGGILIISFPIDESLETVYEDRTIISPEERRLEYGETGNRRLFGRDSAKLLEKAGFEVSLIDGKECPKEMMPVVGPADYDVNYLFLCWKRVCV